jgi:sec-independent protein translocase protein TatC
MASRLRIPLRARDDASMPLLEHLDELRTRIFKVGIVFILASIVAWFFRVQVFNFLMAPSEDVLGYTLQFTNVTSPILTDLKLALYTGLMVSLPVLFYQAWAFVAPAVGEMGRLFTYTLIGLASSLFVGGVAFAYFGVLNITLDFLIGWGGDRYEQIITADAYLSFITRFLLAFGVAFEVPAATFVGAKLGLVDAAFMRKYRRHAIMVNAVVAAMITPAEPTSMIALALPLILLYEVSILIAAKVNPASGITEPANLDEDDKYDEEEYADEDDRDRDRV